MPFPQRDLELLRDLGRRVADIAAMPVQAERRDLWKKHNALKPERPMILVFPEGSWVELMPEGTLRCLDDDARKFEWELRKRIYYHEHLPDDTVIEPEIVVKKVVWNSGWGVDADYVHSTEKRGAYRWNPVIQTEADLERLQLPLVQYDEEETQHRLCVAHDVFDEILPVVLKGVDHVSFHLMSLLCRLHGLEQVMVDMLDNPGFLHKAMGILEEGNRGIVQQYVDMELLDLNNDQTYHSSGGVGYIDELPSDGYDGHTVRPRDMWASAEAQELAQVSPQMHYEFSMQYEMRLLEPFGLNGYGCCEDLTRKLPDVKRIPNIRRISCSPWADVPACAEQLGSDYIFSWKPHPAHLAGEFHEEMIRSYIGSALDAAEGCVFEMVLKDTHTCDKQPERFTRWLQIAREAVEARL